MAGNDTTASGSGDRPNAIHKVRKSGGKLKKKAALEKKERYNPKAFTFSGGVNSVQRRAQRTLDLQTKREKSKLIINKTPDVNPPPVVVVVQGPPGVGKTTLIQSLVKHYTRHNISEVKGSVTLVAGKNRRLTFIECSNDASAMLDAAKIADLVLLMVDGSFGFEMESYEFLNILQVHGFPKVLGVLTHLDKIPESSTLRRTKKTLKNRFWAEIYNGAKLFYLSGLQYGRYNKTEILNLSRFIAVQKIKPTLFRSQRPYLLSLRLEDHTLPSNNQNDTKTVHIYGYINGATMRPKTTVHIPGAGDFIADSISEYIDPCPLPTKKSENKNDGGRLLRTLKTQDRRIYAPQCDIGNVSYEPDALYIQVPDHQIGFTREIDHDDDSDSRSTGTSSHEDSENEQQNQTMPEAVTIVRHMQDNENQLDTTLSKQTLRLMTKSHSLLTVDDPKNHQTISNIRRRVPDNHEFDNTSSYSDVSMDDAEDIQPQQAVKTLSESLSHHELSDDNSEESDNNIENEFDSSILFGRRRIITKDEVEQKFRKTPSLNDLVYNIDNMSSTLIKSTHLNYFNIGMTDLQQKQQNAIHLFDDENDANERDHLMDITNHTMSKSQLLGDIILMTRHTEYHMAESSVLSIEALFSGIERSAKTLKDLNSIWTPTVERCLKKKKFITGGWDGGSTQDAENCDVTHPINDEHCETYEKENKKTTDRVEDDIAEQREIYKKEQNEQKTQLEDAQALLRDNNSGNVIGTYVRIIIHGVPSNWLSYVTSSNKQIIVGGLLPNESNQSGLIQARLKKHRWTPKILKTNDPLLISVGWRRFQTLPIYCMEDRNNSRVRMLKYTPEHLHCLATFYGPVQAPGAGVLAISNWASNVKNFRISATGLILEAATDFRIVKKLKLVGEPQKIFKNTAFVKKMFTSDLEVSKCIGAKIQTVSGIRGQIKKAQGTNGVFRAGFEDKILLSDIIICKAWVRVEPKEFCNPLLDVPGWRRLRSIKEIRNDLQLPPPDASAQNYGKQPERQIRRFNPLRIPKEIEKNLPFKSRPKDERAKKKPTGLVAEATTTELNPYEKKVATLFNRLHLITKARTKERKTAAITHQKTKAKEEARIQAIRDANSKTIRKKRNAIQGAKEKNMRKRVRMED